MSHQEKPVSTKDNTESPKATDKGKAPAPVEQQEEESDSEMEEEDSKIEEEDAGEESDDDMGEIDTSNIIESGRTRGKRIDYTKEVGNVPEAEDEEDDADFEAPADAEA